MLTLSMFQCMVKLEHDVNLRTLWRSLEATSLVICAHPPGQLGIYLTYMNCVENELYQIGSLSIKIKVCEESINISMLIFKNGRVKVSGGLGKMECDKTLTDIEFCLFFHETILFPVMQSVFGFTDTNHYVLQKKNINASMKMTKTIGKELFLEFLDRLSTRFNHNSITLPEIMQRDGKRRGRICAVKVKNVTGKAGSFAVDHGGKVQFFAYSSIDDLKSHTEDLLSIWS